MTSWQPLLFAPFAVRCDIAFFAALQQLKLHKLKLSTSAVQLNASVSATGSTHSSSSTASSQASSALPPQLNITQESFVSDAPDDDDRREQTPSIIATPLSHHEIAFRGTLHNTNTLEEFQRLPYAQLLSTLGQEIAQSIVVASDINDNNNDSGDALQRPDHWLNRFLLLTFAELKSHTIHYWAAIPALIDDQLTIESCCQSTIENGTTMTTSQLNNNEQHQFAIAYRRFVAQHPTSLSLFIYRSPDDTTQSTIQLQTLHEYSQWQQSNRDASHNITTTTLCFIDSATGAHPSWPLRNALLLVACRLKLKQLRVLCLRNVAAILRHTSSASIDSAVSSDDASTVVVAQPALIAFEHALYNVRLTCKSELNRDTITRLRTVGYERNAAQRLAPRQMNLASLLDDRRLAQSSVALNLQLMRWRELPELNLDLLSRQKCLLLGAGTLGCNVARLLLAWGVRHLSFVDSGTVSYSNPVRQSLYRHTDCVTQPPVYKANAAARALTEIYPLVVTESHCMQIAMPGHASASPEDEQATRSQVDKLTQLIQSHDAVFLLTDSRESRWLPTLLCQALHRPCLNAALGFDSFLVMRHGEHTVHDEDEKQSQQQKQQEQHKQQQSESSTVSQSPSLGCYFCSDVVAPANSQRERTLDQQCTVTRPGLAYQASALVTELYVSLLHHPQRQRAPASQDESATLLGALPHQMRGGLRRFNTQMLLGERFDHCTACSDTILRAYAQHGTDFVMRAINSQASFLEDTSGLTEMKRATEQQMAQLHASMQLQSDDEAESDDF